MDLRQYIENLKSLQQLISITNEVDACLEISALTDLVSKQSGPGLLFQTVSNSDIPVAMNLFGSDQRMAAALGHQSLVAFGGWLTSEFRTAKGESSAEKLHQLIAKVRMIQQPPLWRQRNVDLGFLPEMRYWPAERRSFLTLAVVITRDQKSDIQNYGLYRVGIAGSRKLTLNLLPGSGAGRHLALWRQADQKMPIAIALGADPALIYAAAAPLPHSCAEAEFSAFLQHSDFLYSPCATVPLVAPSSAQIIIEGWVGGCSTLNEGPFGCFRGDYGGRNDCPLIDVSSIAMVNDPLIPLTLAGPLPMEDSWIARANLELIQARLRIDLPEVRSLEMPLDAAFHGLYFVRVTNMEWSVNDIAVQMQALDCLRHIKMLVLLTEEENINESGWRQALGRIPEERIWQDPDVNIDDLLIDKPAILTPNRSLQRELVQRLGLDEYGLSVPI